MSTDLLRIEANERIDQQDFEFLSDTQQQAALRVPANFWTDPTQQRLWILSGFEMSNPAGKQVQVTRGRALLGMREAGQVYYGMLAVAGDATKIVDITAFGAGTYEIYIRFEYVDAETQSRVFWNPAGNGTEFAQSIATRQQANWSLRVETSNPGGEWFKIGEVDQATMAITDERDFYFEGAVDATYANVWGAGNDRNADRQQYGVTNMQQFTAAMRTAIEDVKGQGLRRWWDDSIGGMNVGFSGSPTEDRIAIGDANHYMELTGGTVPTWLADTSDALRYSRSSDYWEFLIGNSPAYQGAGDEHRWYISGAESLTLDASSLVSPVNGTLGVSGTRWSQVWSTAGIFGSSTYSADIPFRTRMLSGDNTDQAGGYSEIRLADSYGGEKAAFQGVVNDVRDAGTASDVRCFDALYGGGGAGGGGALTAYSGYRSDFSLTYASSGTTIATFSHFHALGNVGADGDITTLYGFRYDQPAVSGTLVNQYGLRISTVSLATNNYGIWLNGAGDGASDYAIYSNDGRSYFAHTYEGAAGRNGMTTLLIPQVTGGANTFYGAFNVLRTEFSSTQSGTCGVWWARWEKSCAQDITAGMSYRSTLTDSVAASGTLGTFYGFFSEGVLDGFDCTSFRHFQVQNVTDGGSGETLGFQYGLFVSNLTKADANYAVYLSGVGEGENDYAFRSEDGRTYCVHTYASTFSRSAFYWEYVVNTAGGSPNQQGTLHRMRSELSADATGTWTNMYVQSLKSETVRDIAKWVGVRSRLQDDGTVSGEVTEWEGFLSSVRANSYDVPTLKHYVAEDASASGSITTQYGFYCQALAEATNNYGLYIENATTAAIYVANGNTTLQSQVLIGTSEDQEERCIAVTCRNNSAVNAIPAGGIVVCPSGYSGAEIPVQVTAASASDQIFGIALEAIAASGTGRVAVVGIVEIFVDTNGAASGNHVVTSGAAALGAAGGTSSPTTGTVLGRYLETVSGAAGAKAWALIGAVSG